MSNLGLPVLNTSDPEYTSDPYRLLDAIRHRGPVTRAVVDGLEVWLVTGYDEAVQVLASPRMSNDGQRHAGPEAQEVTWTGARQRGLQSHLALLDPPDHTRLRRLTQQAFTPRRVAELEPWIRRLTRELIAAFPASGEVDLIAAFARPLPIAVIAELLGIDPEEREAFLRSVDLYLKADENQSEQRVEAGRELHRLMGALVARRRSRLGDAPLDVAHEGTLTDGLIRAREEHDRLDETELLSLCWLILGAGYETTMSLIGNGTLILLSEPPRLEALLDAPEKLPAAIEEFLRLDSPVKTVFVRYPLEEIELGGVTLRPGDSVLVHHSAVNRDPRHYTDPAAYQPGRGDASRAEARHLSFGHGLHYCLGAPLARLEARVAFEELLWAYPDMELAEPPEELRWAASRLFRGLSALPVRLGKPARPKPATG